MSLCWNMEQQRLNGTATTTFEKKRHPLIRKTERKKREREERRMKTHPQEKARLERVPSSQSVSQSWFQATSSSSSSFSSSSSSLK